MATLRHAQPLPTWVGRAAQTRADGHLFPLAVLIRCGPHLLRPTNTAMTAASDRAFNTLDDERPRHSR